MVKIILNEVEDGNFPQKRAGILQNNPQGLAIAGIFLLSLMLWGCAGDNPASTNEGPVVAPEIGWISLAPRMQLPTSLDAPPEAGWPEPGQEVRWQAHVLNRGSHRLSDAKFTWQVDGVTAESGKTDLSPEETVIEFAHPWNPTREEIGFAIEVDTADGLAVSDELTVISNALTVGLWIEQPIYDWMAEDPAVLPFEPWAQKEVARWNHILGEGNLLPDLSRSGAFSERARDRLRLDRVAVLPAEAPYPRDLDTDLVWYFRQEAGDRRFLHVNSPPAVVQDQTIVFHELLHQRGLIDLYAYEVLHATVNGSDVQILDPDGGKAAGSARMPFLGNSAEGYVLYIPYFANALMGWDYTYPTHLSEHSVYGLNLFAGRRTPRFIDRFGNLIDALADGNPYASHVPERIELLLASPSGEALSNISVDVFLDRGEHIYQDVYTPQPDLMLQADSAGMVVLPSDLWTDPTWRKRQAPTVLILRARAAGNSAWGYAFLPVYNLNLAYIRGDVDTARIHVSIRLQ